MGSWHFWTTLTLLKPPTEVPLASVVTGVSMVVLSVVIGAQSGPTQGCEIPCDIGA